VDWIHVAQDRELGCAFVKMIMNFPVLKKGGDYLDYPSDLIGF
jgi:hypothetical protein